MGVMAVVMTVLMLAVHCRKRLAVVGDRRQPLLALVPEPIQLPASSAALPAAPG